EVIKTQFLLRFFEVVLDPPTRERHCEQGGDRRVLGGVRKEVLGLSVERIGCDDEPFLRVRRVCMRDESGRSRTPNDRAFRRVLDIVIDPRGSSANEELIDAAVLCASGISAGRPAPRTYGNLHHVLHFECIYGSEELADSAVEFILCDPTNL